MLSFDGFYLPHWVCTHSSFLRKQELRKHQLHSFGMSISSGLLHLARNNVSRYVQKEMECETSINQDRPCDRERSEVESNPVLTTQAQRACCFSEINIFLGSCFRRNNDGGKNSRIKECRVMRFEGCHSIVSILIIACDFRL